MAWLSRRHPGSRQSAPTRTRLAILLGCAVGVAAITTAFLLRQTQGPSFVDTRAPIAMFQEPARLLTDPAGTLATLRQLGVDAVRVQVQWQLVAPGASAAGRPPGFRATDPAAYAASSWRPYDAIVTDARRQGIEVELLLTGGAPRWAVGAADPGGVSERYWKPSAAEYGQFVQATATRYSGHYRPPGARAALPEVRFWELWNEPNFGQDLAPQAVSGSTVSTSPYLYRGLLDAGWSALQATGHGADTVIMGSLSPRGFSHGATRQFPEGLPGNFSTTKPLQFLRTLYCVGSSYQPLRGPNAAVVGCPSTASASRRFRSDHPALFDASGFGIHPYPFDLPPAEVDSHDPDFAEFGQLGRLAGTLDRLQQTYGSSRRLEIYNTEYGYITDPPNDTLHYGRHFLAPSKAAEYLNWAEYLSWRNPRLATTMQYLLYDPYPKASGFATGLISYSGRAKPTFDAYRLPVFLPVTITQRGKALEVWGCVRPLRYASTDSHGAGREIQIQFRAGGSGAFRTVGTAPVDNVAGYFDVRVQFPAAGAVRLMWRYPSGQTVYSRTVAITAR